MATLIQTVLMLFVFSKKRAVKRYFVTLLWGNFHRVTKWFEDSKTYKKAPTLKKIVLIAPMITVGN